MDEIKPNWLIAQQISKRHTFISLGVTLPLMLSLIVLSIVTLKIIGVANAGVVLRVFFELHQKVIWTILVLIHFGPINYYAIIKVFKGSFPGFELKVINKK